LIINLLFIIYYLLFIIYYIYCVLFTTNNTIHIYISIYQKSILKMSNCECFSNNINIIDKQPLQQINIIYVDNIKIIENAKNANGVDNAEKAENVDNAEKANNAENADNSDLYY